VTPKTVKRHVVCTAEELPEGSSRIVEIEGRSIGVFNVGGDLHALRNSCPHKGAPLCKGTVGGTMLPSEPHEYVYGREGSFIRCPWHGWEIDLATGRPFFDPERGLVRVYTVGIEDGNVVVDL
jgi:3-phenylpropionate/trans-cinnamate dioxygenase ferredoxin subunit